MKVYLNTDDKSSLSNNQKTDHFVYYEGKLFAGHHYLVDVWGNGKYLTNEEEIKTILRESALSAGASILHILSHKFEKGQGISGIAILAESHISVHTWPERSFAAFDIFLCGDANPEESLRTIKKHTGSKKVQISKIKRGLIGNKNIE